MEHFLCSYTSYRFKEMKFYSCLAYHIHNPIEFKVLFYISALGIRISQHNAVTKNELALTQSS